MKTWNQFLEDKQNEGMDQLSNQVVPVSTRKSATLDLTPAQRLQGQQAYQAAQQPQPQVPPVSTRRSATLNLTPAQRLQGQQAYQAAQQQG